MNSTKYRRVVGTAQTGIATGSPQTQAGATPLTDSFCVIGTNAAGGNGVILPAGRCNGDSLVLLSTVATNAVAVYPPVGGTINGGTANAAFSLAAQKGAEFFCYSDDGLSWLVNMSA